MLVPTIAKKALAFASAISIAISAACNEQPTAPIEETDCLKKYDLATLQNWRQNTLYQVWSVEGVSSVSLNESKLCLHVGVIAKDIIPKVEGRLAEIGIPRDAVYINVVPNAPAT